MEGEADWLLFSTFFTCLFLYFRDPWLIVMCMQLAEFVL